MSHGQTTVNIPGLFLLASFSGHGCHNYYSKFIQSEQFYGNQKMCSSTQSFNLIQDKLKFTIYGPLIQSIGNS